MSKISMIGGKKPLFPATVIRRKEVDNELVNIPVEFFYEYPEDKKGKEREDTQIMNGRMGSGEQLEIIADTDMEFFPQEIIKTLIDGTEYNISKATPIRETAYNDRQRRFGEVVPANIKQRLLLDN